MDKSKEEFSTELNRLATTYGISDSHASCYICNYGDKFICHKYNNGCKTVEKCKEIYEKEKDKRE